MIARILLLCTQVWLVNFGGGVDCCDCRLGRVWSVDVCCGWSWFAWLWIALKSILHIYRSHLGPSPITMRSVPRNVTFLAPPPGDLDSWIVVTPAEELMDGSPDRRVRGPTAKAPREYSHLGRRVRARTRGDQPEVIMSGSAEAAKAMTAAASGSAKDRALKALEDGLYAASSRGPQLALVRTWTKFHQAWFKGTRPVIPLSQESLKAVGAMFKCGGYTSFRNYIYAMKSEHVRQGHQWNQAMDKTAKDVIRSVLRGLGPSKRSDPLHVNFALDVTQSWGTNHCRLDRPCNASAMTLAGIYFMTREIELSGALQHEMSVHDNGKVCTWLLPASKKDHEAAGVTRTIECMCDMTQVCPTHFLQKYLKDLKEFGDRLGIDSDALPLFPNPEGRALKKHEVVAMVRDIAREYMPEASEDVIDRHTGHIFRITGARHYSHLGMDPLTIAIHGRWTSNAILTYLADAPLQSMRSRMRPSDGPKHEPEFAGHRDRMDDNQLTERIKALEEALKIPEPAKPVVTVGYVSNLSSMMIHLQRKPEPYEQTHEWTTKCGWKWAGKPHVQITQAVPLGGEGQKWKDCPKCFPKSSKRRQKDEDSDSHTTSSSSSSDS